MSYNITDRTDRKTHIHYLADGALSLEKKGLWDAGTLYRLELYIEEKLKAFKEWKDQIVYQRNLSRLNDRLLEDIGLARGDVKIEANRLFWRD